MNVHKGIAYELQERNAAFSLWFIGIFTLSYAFLFSIDVVPDPTARWNYAHSGTAIETVAADTGPVHDQPPAPVDQSELPLRVVAEEIGLDATISNPETTDTAALDKYLKSGAVRYPTSALLGVDGTVVLFAHSSYLPVVANPAYKTFTDIQKLRKGSEVSVYSGTREFRYEVSRVYKVAASDGVVELMHDGKYLTLVTCDTFNKVLTDRWIVESKLVGIYTIGN
jgi:LPXTG-site transpeptidase (sortase) family protein